MSMLAGRIAVLITLIVVYVFRCNHGARLPSSGILRHATAIVARARDGGTRLVEQQLLYEMRDVAVTAAREAGYGSPRGFGTRRA